MIEINPVSSPHALAAARDLIREHIEANSQAHGAAATAAILAALPAPYAQNLYASLGFRPIEAYRAVEFGDTLFYELEIGVAT